MQQMIDRKTKTVKKVSFRKFVGGFFRHRNGRVFFCQKMPNADPFIYRVLKSGALCLCPLDLIKGEFHFLKKVYVLDPNNLGIPPLLVWANVRCEDAE